MISFHGALTLAEAMLSVYNSRCHVSVFRKSIFCVDLFIHLIHLYQTLWPIITTAHSTNQHEAIHIPDGCIKITPNDQTSQQRFLQRFAYLPPPLPFSDLTTPHHAT